MSGDNLEVPTGAKTFQVNLKYNAAEYTELLNIAQSLYDRKQINDRKVASMIRWLVKSYADTIAAERAKQIEELKKQQIQQELMEYLKNKYGGLENIPRTFSLNQVIPNGK